MSQKPFEMLLFWTGIAALMAALSAPALAHGAVRLDQLDASRYPELSATAVTSSVTGRPPLLAENGRPAAGLVAENLADAKSVVVAVDRSMSMRGGSLERAIVAAREFVAAKKPGDRLAVLSFGSRSVLVSRFSTATIDADAALRTLDVDARQGTALNDAVALAARELGTERTPARVLVLLTDGTDQGSVANADTALRAARRAGVTVYTIGIEGPQFSSASLERFARETGGTYRGAAGVEAVAQAYAAVTWDLRRTWRLTWMTRARRGESVALEAKFPGAGSDELEGRIPGHAVSSSAPKSVVPGALLTNALAPAVVGLACGFLVLLAVLLLGAARRGSWVRRRLAPHLGHRRAEAGRPKERFAAGNALVDATEKALGELKFWRKVHGLLERADVPLKTAEFFYIVVGAGFGAGMLAAISAQASFVILLAFVGGGGVPFGWVWWRARRRLKAFDNQLPDLLLTLAASLKAGHSFKQGLQTIVDEGVPPASEEFRRVLAEVQLGRPMDLALREMTERVGSSNLEFVITAVTIQTQVGGSMAGLFDMVAEAVRNRQQFARKIRSLTAMGRASAYVLVGLPFLIAAALTLLNGEYMAPLYQTSTGHMLIFVGLGMMAFGSLILKKIVSFRG